jgi:hypothetical protein
VYGKFAPRAVSQDTVAESGRRAAKESGSSFQEVDIWGVVTGALLRTVSAAMGG